MPRIRLALAQTNPVVGDLAGNSAQILEAARAAAAQGADLLATGEMALSGYPIEDLASRPSFLTASHRGRHLAKRCRMPGSATCRHRRASRTARSNLARSAPATRRRRSPTTARACCTTAT
jgi:hypothetical protein